MRWVLVLVILLSPVYVMGLSSSVVNTNLAHRTLGSYFDALRAVELETGQPGKSGLEYVKDGALFLKPFLKEQPDGSYTLPDAVNTPKEKSVSISSSYVTDFILKREARRYVPELKIRMSENPETEKYHISYIQVGIPLFRIWFGYEPLDENDDYSATVEWRQYW